MADVMALEAGRDLDARVADLLGVTRPAWIPKREWLVHPGLGQYTENGWNGVCPPYSTEIAAAWQVVERMGLSVAQDKRGWAAYRPEWEVKGEIMFYDSAPLAICRRRTTSSARTSTRGCPLRSRTGCRPSSTARSKPAGCTPSSTR